MLDRLKPGATFPLDEMGTWPESHHCFDEPAVWAVQAAWAARRPLLIQGEPGCGKSQLARAVAQAMKWAFIPAVVDHRRECADLQWRFDAVARLGQAQLLSTHGQVVGKNAGDVLNAADSPLAPSRFLAPGPLWWAVNWKDANRQNGACTQAVKTQRPHSDHCGKFDPEQGPAGRVLLIDEIDKAQVDLPNGLLEVLDNGGFSIPHLETGFVGGDGIRPLVIITTNRERSLPQAFMRRCFVYTMNLEKDETKFKAWLVKRGKVHFGKKANCYHSVLQECADQLWRVRQEAEALDEAKPGQGEYLDLVRALMELDTAEEAQRARIAQIAQFALDKKQQVGL